MAGRAAVAAPRGRSVAQTALHRAVLAAAILAAALFLFAGGGIAALASWPVQYLAPAAALYLASHGLRAVRLAIMAARILKLSARSGALVHLVTAPAVVIPFKLGEVVRLHQLWYLGRSLPGAVLVLVVERFFDAAMLLLLLAVVYAAQGPLGAEAVILFAATSVAVAIVSSSSSSSTRFSSPSRSVSTKRSPATCSSSSSTVSLSESWSR